jgi:hypothetical protein
VFNYVTNLRRCNCGTYFIILHCACAWTFLCFSIWYRWSLLALNGFLLCRPLNVCDHEVTAVKKWRTSTCFELFFRVLRWYFTNREASVNAWAGVLFILILAKHKRRYSGISVLKHSEKIQFLYTLFLSAIFTNENGQIPIYSESWWWKMHFCTVGKACKAIQYNSIYIEIYNLIGSTWLHRPLELKIMCFVRWKDNLQIEIDLHICRMYLLEESWQITPLFPARKTLSKII